MAIKDIYFVYAKHTNYRVSILDLLWVTDHGNQINHGFVAASIAFGLNSAGYIAEIYRAALSSVDKGQWEAAKALNIPYWKAMRLIILPQAIRIAIPPLANVFLSVMLGTSLAAIITVPELFQKSQIVAGRTFDAMTMYIMVAFVYWPIGIAISYLQDRLEARYGKYVDIKANRAIN